MPKIGNVWFKGNVTASTTMHIESGTANTDVQYVAKRTDTNTQVWMGVGSGGVNHGIWSTKLNKWILYADATNIFLSGGDIKIAPGGDIDSSGYNHSSKGFYSRETGSVNTPVGNGNLIIKRASSSEAPNNGVVLEFGNSTRWAGQLFIGDNADQGIYFNGWSSGTRGTWKRLAEESKVQAKATSLYDNSTGTTGTVTLSDSAANYTYLEIYTKRGSWYPQATKVYSPNGKTVDIGASYSDGTNMYVYSKQITISGTSITNKFAKVGYFGGTTQVINDDSHAIVKVLGYK